MPLLVGIGWVLATSGGAIIVVKVLTDLGVL